MSAEFVDQWLNEILPSGEKRVERLCFLITANGGIADNGYGFIYHAGNGEHQRGLEMDDAIELRDCVNFMSGLKIGSGVDPLERIMPHLEEYIKPFIPKEL